MAITMNCGQSLFAQLMDHLPRHEFRQCVQRYDGNYRVRSFSCWDQFLCMAFAQLTFRESLRVSWRLRSQERRLYHLGIRGTVSRSTLADANESRDWRIYADSLGLDCRSAATLRSRGAGAGLGQHRIRLGLHHRRLCMTMFPWARYKSAQHALKLHTLLDLRGSIPTFIRVTAAQVHDVNILDALTPEAGAFYVMDRAYLDFERLYRWTLQGAFFVTRARKNFRFTRLLSHPVDKTTGVQCDQTIALVWFYTAHGYPARLRRIRYWDAEHNRRLVFLTNNFVLSAPVITDLYRCRWQVELFFKWIKQNLRIKAFYGTSENAVKTQIWIAVCSYLLVAIVRKRRNLETKLSTMLQILSVSPFEKTPMQQAFSTHGVSPMETESHNQLRLLDF